jgi:TonB family protein
MEWVSKDGARVLPMDDRSLCCAFSSLPRRHPWKAWVVSYSAQSSLLLLLLTGSIIAPRSGMLIERRLTPLAAIPSPLNHTPQPPRTKLIPPPLPSAEQPLPAKLNAPIEVVPAPTRHPLMPRASLPVPPASAYAPPIHTGVFSTGSSEVPTVNLRPQEVQTGGFGDPNGVPSSAKGNSRPNIAQLGSFDLPLGAGHGNGMGGTQSTRGIVDSAGFGSGIATGGDSGTGPNRGAVRPSGFANQQPVPAIPPRTAIPGSPILPVEIISKPKPVYTEEARKRGIEGEVVLEVVFKASAQIRVVRILRGLGHGLDEAAIQAATQIRFRPAQRDGNPVDTTVILHIVFEIA